jgi:ATP-binding cassette subfamily G (WHITE) protein 2 (PDR)
VVVTKASLPGFWLFMYRLSPFTYLIGGLLTTATGHAEIICADNEYSRFLTPLMVTCGEYMAPYITSHGGYLLDPLSTSECTFCPLSATDTYLAKLDLNYGDRWRNFGILWAYIIFNVAGAMAIYWLARVSKGKRS